MKDNWLQDLADTIACPHCDSVMIKNEHQTYTCTNCGVRVWADPIGCGLVRYNILPAESSDPPRERREGN
jgi:DNA-directed RNA polymerase subunit RPC12/RpoP